MAQKAQGSVCNTSVDCKVPGACRECATAGGCVDGYCCDKACNGKCNACNATPGTCTIVPAGSPGTGTTCSPYVCGGTSAGCPTACANDF